MGAANQNRQTELITKQTLEKLPLIYRAEGSATRVAMGKFIEKNRITVKKKIQITSNEAATQAVIAGIDFSSIQCLYTFVKLSEHDLSRGKLV